MARPSDEARGDGESEGEGDAAAGPDADGSRDPDRGDGRHDAVVETDGDGIVTRSTDEDTPWRFGIDEVGEVVDSEADEEDLPRPPLEPETISAENALFVVLGAALTVLIIVGTL
jgi:hypothetical protein